jgi:hypothetical protein
MKRWLTIGTLIVLTAIPALAVADEIKQTVTTGPYRLELEVLPPEPFYSAKQVAAGQAKSGMLILGGAEPVQPSAPSHPNHHLVVHVFQKSTGKALTHATVQLTFQPLDSNGNPSGKPQEVPVVRMQMIMPSGMSGMAGMEGMAGMGAAATTHYANNVSLPPGAYRVELIANGHRGDFKITVE